MRSKARTEPTPAMVAALQYVSRGWSVIPMKMQAKKPPVRWRRYQTAPACPNTLRRWFQQRDYGIAVIFGEISGGLISRDFDTMGSYLQWKRLHPELAATLPTVATRRGRHVYARATAASIQAARRALGKPEDRTGALKVVDGEVRCGIGCYSVLPPSMHPSGHVYRWTVELPDGEMPEVDLLTSGFIEEERCDIAFGVYRGSQRFTEAIGAVEIVRGEWCVAGQEQLATEAEGVGSRSEASTWSPAVLFAIADTLPSEVGQRNSQVFELARALKAVPELNNADGIDLRPYVRHWHQIALPHISTKPFDETWIDFLKAWPNVKYPRGQEPMALVFENARAQPLPEIAERYEQPQLRLLVALCRELQRGAGEGPFYLACRTAGRLLDVDHSTANRWLFLLAAEGLLAEVEKGNGAQRRASRYRYLGEL